MAGALYLYGHEKYQGSILNFPIFWIYLSFVIGNSALGVVGTWLSEIYPDRSPIDRGVGAFIYMALTRCRQPGAHRRFPWWPACSAAISPPA